MGAYHRCSLKDSTQQEIEADAETQKPNYGQSAESLTEEER